MVRQPFLTVLVLFICCIVLMQGIPTSIRERCLCRKSELSFVNMNHVAKVEYHKSSSSCGQEELIVFFKSSGRRGCLNLQQRQGRRIKEAIMKNEIRW